MANFNAHDVFVTLLKSTKQKKQHRFNFSTVCPWLAFFSNLFLFECAYIGNMKCEFSI